MQCIDDNFRLEQVPILSVRGTNFIVGYSIGRTFKSLINDLLEKWTFYKTVALPKYETEEGRLLYEKSLNICKNKFPKYVEEIQGMAHGANVEFHKLFILHVDSLMCYSILGKKDDPVGTKGCTAILCNNEEIVLGHTEDADSELLNNIYFVAAEITDDNGKVIEKFTTLTYSGHLPGYTMGFNHHGMIYSVNTIYPTDLYHEGTPRAFVARALLNARNLEEAVSILRDKGNGIADGLSVNIYFLRQNPEHLMHNIEVGPGNGTILESLIDVLALHKGESLAHCNIYLRIKIAEKKFESSIQRHHAIQRHAKPISVSIIKDILSDQSDPNLPVFRADNQEDVKTVAVGIFELHHKQPLWKIYIGKPNATEPVAIIPIDL